MFGAHGHFPLVGLGPMGPVLYSFLFSCLDEVEPFLALEFPLGSGSVECVCWRSFPVSVWFAYADRPWSVGVLIGRD